MYISLNLDENPIKKANEDAKINRILNTKC